MGSTRACEKVEKEVQCVEELVEKAAQTDKDILEFESGSSFTISTDSQKTDMMSSILSLNDRTLIDDLRLNLRIKENIIETVNDNLVLKEAEIMSLKSRIGIYERKKQSSGIND